MGPLSYDYDGNPISYEKWSRLFGDTARRHVAVTEVGTVEVSTVWIGLDTSFGGPVPLIYETMIFGGPDDLDGRQWSWPNRDAALAGHDQVVALVREVVHATP